jgi:hypothetical protein
MIITIELGKISTYKWLIWWIITTFQNISALITMLFILKQTVICDNDEKCFLNEDATNATKCATNGSEELALCYGGSSGKHRLMIGV